MKNHFFTIEGDRISGRYIVSEWKDGNFNLISEISGRHYGGFK